MAGKQSPFSFKLTTPNYSTNQIRAPPSKDEGLLREAVRSDPYSFVAWNALIEYCEQTKDLSKIRQTYNWLLDTFPNTVRFQLALIFVLCTGPIIPIILVLRMESFTIAKREANLMMPAFDRAS